MLLMNMNLGGDGNVDLSARSTRFLVPLIAGSNVCTA